MHLLSKEKENISSESLEATRIAINKHLTKCLGKENFHLRIRPHPHHIIRANKMLSCAGADRLSSGMRGAFGKPTGRVARIKINQPIVAVRYIGKKEDVGEALRRGIIISGRQQVIW